MNNFLLFTENYLSDADDIESADELIFFSVSIIDSLIEHNDEMPSKRFKNIWKDLLRETNSFYTRFGGEAVMGSIKIENDEVKTEVLERCTDKERSIITAFSHNISYLLDLN